MLFKQLGNKEAAKASEEANVVGHCRNCGSVKTTFYTQGSFVLIRPRGARPFYGRIMDVQLVDDKPQAIIERNYNEREFYPIEDVYPLGEELNDL